MSPAQLSGTARICLSVGYRTDDMDVALGSALLLAALGERAYGELMGHHLAQGIGTAKRPDLALAWYQMGLDAVEEGGRPVFAPGQPERQALIRKAAYQAGRGPRAPRRRPRRRRPRFRPSRLRTDQRCRGGARASRPERALARSRNCPFTPDGPSL